MQSEISIPSFFRGRAGVRALIEAGTTLLPIVALSVVVYGLSAGWMPIGLLGRIHGNFYTVNAMLLSLIVSSYAMILISWVFYVWESIHLVRKGSNGFLLFLNAAPPTLITVYMLYIGLCFALGDQVGRWFNYGSIIWGNQLLSFSIFTMFFVGDLVAWRDARKSMADASTHLAALDAPDKQKEINSECARAFCGLEFCRTTLFIISVPTMVVTGISILLRAFLEHSPLFQTFIDKSFLSGRLLVPTLDSNVYSLFIDGLETGIIGSVLIISQLIFIMARLRLRFHHFVLKGGSAIRFWSC